MRQIQVQVSAPEVGRVLSIAEARGGRAPFVVEGSAGGDSGSSLLLINLPNDAVGAFLEEVEAAVEGACFTLFPLGSLPIETPLGTIQESVRDVSPLAPVELVLSSLQSIGSWRGMLLYSVFSGIVGAYGIIFDASYLLVAAMLINPMGAPAMVSVVGLAVGDARMFGRGALRFGISLVLQALAAAVLGFAYGLSFSTPTMEQITGLSALAAGLAAVAGAAGAQSQIQSERDSLVSGTAAGFMVAAALAPPAAVLGLSFPIGRWDYTALMGFLLLVQFVAIGLGGWLALLVFGVRPGVPALPRGSSRVRGSVAGGLAIAAALLVAWQLGNAPSFLKADLSRDAIRVARESVREVGGVGLVEATARFTRSDLDRHPGESILVAVVVERLPHAERADSTLEREIRARIGERVRAEMTDVVPLVDVTVLPPASEPPPRGRARGR